MGAPRLIYAIDINGAWVAVQGTITVPNAYSYERQVGEGPETETVFGDLQISENDVMMMTPQARTAKKIFPVQEPDEIPYGWRVADGGQLEIVNNDANRPKFSWPIVEMTLEELKGVRLNELNNLFLLKNQEPFPWDFGSVEGKLDNGDSVGPAGEQTLQMRVDATTDDVKNWLGAQSAAAVAVQLQQPDTLQPLKTTDNVWVQTTAAQVLQVLVTGDGEQISMLERQRRVLERFGAHKASLAAATTRQAVMDLDFEAGWPGS